LLTDLPFYVPTAYYASTKVKHILKTKMGENGKVHKSAPDKASALSDQREMTVRLFYIF
jgi:hypothetical protein